MPEPEDILIEWRMESHAASGAADITVFADGRVRLSDRLGGGELRLSRSELEAVRSFVFDEQGLLELDSADLDREVRAEVEARRETEDTEHVALAVPLQMDAGTTVVRGRGEDGMHEVRYYNVAGDAAAHPELDKLQRLRRIELRLLEIAGQR